MLENLINLTYLSTTIKNRKLGYSMMYRFHYIIGCRYHDYCGNIFGMVKFRK